MSTLAGKELDQDFAAAFHLHDRPLRREQCVEPLVRSGLAQRVELGRDADVELLPRDGAHWPATLAT